MALLYSSLLGKRGELTFATDASLTVMPGWDNVTGTGTRNGAALEKCSRSVEQQIKLAGRGLIFDEMAGMSFDHQPDRLIGSQFQ